MNRANIIFPFQLYEAHPSLSHSNSVYLVEELDRGGMGVFYKADQFQPIKRSVAFKIIKLDMEPLTTETRCGFCAVHDIDLAGGKCGILGGQEREQRSDLFGFSVPP